MITPVILSASSTAPLTAPIRTLTSSTAYVVPPQAKISPIDQVQGGYLIYPSDRPKYYINFDIYDYKRDKLMSIGALDPSKRISQVILPLPSNLADMNHEVWQDNVSIGQLIGGAVDNLGVPLINSIREKGLEGLSQSAQDALTALGNTGAADALKNAGGVIASQSDTLRALLGISPNQFMTVLFVNPVFKRHDFAWAISPHNQNEADTIRRIINTFKNAMAPGLAVGGLIFTFPKIFKIAFQPNSKWMYKFKPAVLESFSVNYTPAGRAAFYKDKGGGNPPEGVTIAMRFIELEYWLNGDHNDSNDPNDVYTTNGIGSIPTQTPPQQPGLMPSLPGPASQPQPWFKPPPQ